MRFLKSICCALRGIYESFQTGRNLRIQLVIFLYVLSLSPFFLRTHAEWAVVILTAALVMAGEIFNTALERLTDHTVHGFSSLARAAKDAAAGAVLVCAVAAVVIGCIFFIRPEGWAAFRHYCTGHVWYPLALGILLVPSGIFIFHA